MTDTVENNLGETSGQQVSDTAQVPTSTPASVTPYRESRGRLIAEVAMAIVVVGALIFFGVTLASQSNKINSQSNDIATLQHQVNADSTALAAFSRSSPKGFAKSLQSQLSSIKSALNTTNVTAASTGSSVSGLKATVTQVQQQLANICSSTAVSNEESTINGEETGSGSGYNQYYGDLLGVIDAVCQPSSSAG
jgi:hypothetical protein